MTIQTVNLGTAPSGAGGDTFRSTGAKINENFANWNHAASRYVGVNAGNVMEVGAYGLGTSQVGTPAIDSHKTLNNGFYGADALEGFPYNYGEMIVLNQTGWVHRLFFPAIVGAAPYISSSINGGPWSTHGVFIVLNKNATTDGNGFVKAASPVIKLFAEKIEPNEEALEQEPTFKKVDVGHYLLKNTEGFSDDGWYIEMPKDANGNVLVAVQYQQLEDNTIEVKTFAKKFDEETGDIIPNLAKPRDIPEGRWIDIRLKELPKAEIKISHTPDDFQPTNLAQAVAEALKDDSEQ